jgi:hypothetical protein
VSANRPAGGQLGGVTPEPTDEELAAIMAAYEALWPRPAIAAPRADRGAPPRWRFSGRWWAKPVPLRRDR